MERRIAAHRASYRADIAAHHKQKRKGHQHEYVRHSNPDWATHLSCRICGFALTEREARQHAPQRIVYEENS